MIGWLVLPLALLAGGSSPLKVHTVEIRGMAFHPDTLIVKRGDTIVWINGDFVPHTATAARRWDTGSLAQGEMGRYAARQTGEFAYRCTLHPVMRGVVIVEP